MLRFPRDKFASRKEAIIIKSFGRKRLYALAGAALGISLIAFPAANAQAAVTGQTASPQAIHEQWVYIGTYDWVLCEMYGGNYVAEGLASQFKCVGVPTSKLYVYTLAG